MAETWYGPAETWYGPAETWYGPAHVAMGDDMGRSMLTRWRRLEA
jgi:hypothetical protein